MQGHAVVRLPGVPLLRAGEQEGAHPRGQPAMDDHQAGQISEAMAVHDHKGTTTPPYHKLLLLKYSKFTIPLNVS